MARYHIRVFQMDSKGKHTWREYVHPDDLDLTLDAWLGQEAETQHILESLDTVGLASMRWCASSPRDTAAATAATRTA